MAILSTDDWCASAMSGPMAQLEKESAMLCSYASLDTKSLDAIKEFETKTNVNLLAVACQEVQAATLDKPTQEALQKLEKDLGLVLVAYQ